MKCLTPIIAVLLHSIVATNFARADEVTPTIASRFDGAKVTEEPSFQRHVLPLMGKLGCNGRACHGSFQGQGDFRLSLFGYDFDTDHKALLNGGSDPRVDIDDPLGSLIIVKPTDEDQHEGGLRYEEGGWEYHVFRRWIETGAKNDGHKVGVLEHLEIIPAEVIFNAEKDSVQLQAIAHWDDGTNEDVTPLCRFQSNDDAVAAITVDGLVTSTGAGDTHIVAFYDNGIKPVPVMLPISAETAKDYPKVATPTKVDEFVVEKLKKLGVLPSEVCSDEAFLRRASLDITGTLPTPQEVETFLADKSKEKRATKIDELLKRPGYSAWWTTKFGDWTGNNAQNSGNNAFRNEESRQWYDWVQHRIESNVPYDEITADIVLATGREEGQSYEEYCAQMGKYYRENDPVDFAEHHSLPQFWSRKNIRQPEEKALAFSYAFMGVRIQCAQCHKHPFDQWSQNDFEQFTAFFGGITYGNRREDRDEVDQMNRKLGLAGKKGNELRRMYPDLLDEGKVIPFLELIYNGRPYQKRGDKDKDNKRKVGRVITPKLLGGDEVIEQQYGDPRVPLMEWLRSDDNPYFAKAFVNRVWANYFHRGIIEPADDLNLANPPSNAPLLDWLTEEFIAHDYNMRWLHRTIVLSDTYQRSWVPNETNVLEEKNFARAVPRRLPAEVVYDALRMAAASDEQRGEWLTDVSQRAIGPTTSYQNRGRSGYALSAFGKPERVENCDCERSFEPSLLQILYVRNDAEALAMIDSRGSWLDQIAKEKNLRFAPSAAPMQMNDKLRQRLADANKQIKRLSVKIDELQADGKGKAAQQLLMQRKKLRDKVAQFGGAAKLANDAAGDGNATDKTLIETEGPALVRQAYLRTLSRNPDDRELTRSLDYLRESETVAVGLRDLMWALVNTKEFLVNH